MIKVCNRIIEYSFYSLFLFVPLAFTSVTFELFEFNKMWLTFGITLIIAAAWFTKMILQKKIYIQRTPLDIPIMLFLASQVISTIFSLDFHVSLWGYYSRFNGGLLSIISYIFLYYAFLSNLTMDQASIESEGWRGWKGSRQRASETKSKEHWREGNPRQDPERSAYAIKIIKRLLFVSLLSGLIVALWGLPSHFGYDPTCLIFRGTLDVSCWTEDFQPKVRIFSTLGQPNWLAAYLAILLPIAIIMFIKVIKNLPLSTFYLLLSALFYLALLYTRARSGIMAVWLSLALFFIAYLLFVRKLSLKLLAILLLILSITFFIGTPVAELDKFTFSGIKNRLSQTKTPPAIHKDAKSQTPSSQQPSDSGGTDSGIIRSIVWPGALNIWKEYPIFGTGVETFAFAYYKFRLPAHNLTSEWNFLYNKAHNEYLNYLATTGIFGLGSYVLMIIIFIFLSIKKLKTQNSKLEKYTDGSYTLDAKRYTLTLALLASYLSILVTNFFGFSVVITNIYLFMIPAFVFVLQGAINPKEQFAFPRNELRTTTISLYQWTFILFIILASLFLILNLVKFWNADKNYALGYNLDRLNEHQEAYRHLKKAVQEREGEPVFKDELSVNSAILAAALLNQKEKNESDLIEASNLAKEAIELSNQIVEAHPNNVVFWKTRTRVFYALSQVDSRYLSQALVSIQKAAELAPTDANISYNLGVILGQNGDVKKGIETLEKSIRLKPDYKDAYHALGLFYHDLAVDENGKVVDAKLQEKAVAQMRYILDRLAPNDTAAKESLKNWGL